MTAAVPPEFGADALLRVVESHKIVDPALRARLVRNAFELAAGAQEPVRRNVSYGISADTDTGIRVISFRLNMDELSLQARAVNDLLLINPREGRALFEQMKFPSLPPLDCEQPLNYEPTAYYETLTAVIRNGFSPQERRDGHRSAFVSSFFSGLQSHSQVAPLARLLAAADLSAEEVNESSTLFGAALEQLQGDPRSFAAAASGNESAELDAFRKLVDLLRSKEIPTFPFVRHVRAYLVTNLAGSRCAGAGEPNKDPLPRVASVFNEKFSADLTTAQLRPIDVNELGDMQVVPKPHPYDFWQIKEVAQLGDDLRKLSHGADGHDLSQAEKSSPEWSGQLSDFLAELNAWDGKGEPEAAVFHEKCYLFELLIDLIPQSPQRARALQRFIEYMEQNRFQQTSRLEWFWHAKRLLDGFEAKDDRQEVLRAFTDSRDPTLSLYGRLETWKAAASNSSAPK